MKRKPYAPTEERKLDVLLAQKIFGLKYELDDCTIEDEGFEHIGGMYRNAFVLLDYYTNESYDFDKVTQECPYYTTNTSDAKLLLEHFRQSQIFIVVKKDTWRVLIDTCFAEESSLELAIVKASLLKYEKENKHTSTT